MLLQVVKQVLMLYSWLAIGAVLFFLWRIAGFYRQASSQDVGRGFLLAAGVLLALGVFSYLRSNPNFIGQPIADIVLFAGGVLLFAFADRLEKLMTGR